ncbi:sulfotransferase family 2 domain-containing protein [Humibacter albus]|uniref:sulfotransferase family 2 domain-containing protein n=1 Tax=Humibacter albus TaxID=427754 RepID=UPI0003B3EA44|nr:sulfotransferase family 2 domain-containing protein [Humibacter albus]
MPILQKSGRSVLFIHVPKAGGSAVEAAFKASGYTVPSSTLDGRNEPGSLNTLRRCSPQHMHAPMLRMNFRLHRFDAIFMVVRDPIERFRSEYLWRHRGTSPAIEADEVESWGLSRLRAYRRDNFVDDNHVRPQWQFVVPKAVVYRLEDGLESAFADLNHRFGLQIVPEARQVRTAQSATGRPSADVEISSRLQTALRRFYRRDYEQFGYGRVCFPRVRRWGAGLSAASRRAATELRSR